MKTKKYYIGCTSDVQKRLRQHNSGGTQSTKPYIPWKLIYCESHTDISEAFEREKVIKSYKGGEAFKKLIIQ